MHNTNSGFTLIETLMYVALLGLLMSGTLMAVYQIIESAGSTTQHNTTQEEAHFVLRKLTWALGGVSGVVVSPTGLTATKYDGSVVDIVLQDGAILMREGAGNTFLPLTTSNVSVTSLRGTAIPHSGAAPPGVEVSFVIDGKSFTTTSYVRN